MQTTLPRERIDKLQAGRKYLQITCHTKNLITKYIKNPYNAIIRQRTQFFLNGQRYLNRYFSEEDTDSQRFDPLKKGDLKPNKMPLPT